MRDEFEALKNVSGAFSQHVDGLTPGDASLFELGTRYAGARLFLTQVTVKELKLVIELAERYAGLCDE